MQKSAIANEGINGTKSIGYPQRTYSQPTRSINSPISDTIRPIVIISCSLALFTRFHHINHNEINKISINYHPNENKLLFNQYAYN